MTTINEWHEYDPRTASYVSPFGRQHLDGMELRINQLERQNQSLIEQLAEVEILRPLQFILPAGSCICWMHTWDRRQMKGDRG